MKDKISRVTRTGFQATIVALAAWRRPTGDSIEHEYVGLGIGLLLI